MKDRTLKFRMAVYFKIMIVAVLFCLGGIFVNADKVIIKGKYVGIDLVNGPYDPHSDWFKDGVRIVPLELPKSSNPSKSESSLNTDVDSVAGNQDDKNIEFKHYFDKLVVLNPENKRFNFIMVDDKGNFLRDEKGNVRVKKFGIKEDIFEVGSDGKVVTEVVPETDGKRGKVDADGKKNSVRRVKLKQGISLLTLNNIEKLMLTFNYELTIDTDTDYIVGIKQISFPEKRKAVTKFDCFETGRRDSCGRRYCIDLFTILAESCKAVLYNYAGYRTFSNSSLMSKQLFSSMSEAIAPENRPDGLAFLAYAQKFAGHENSSYNNDDYREINKVVKSVLASNDVFKIGLLPKFKYDKNIGNYIDIPFKGGFRTYALCNESGYLNFANFWGPDCSSFVQMVYLLSMYSSDELKTMNGGNFSVPKSTDMAKLFSRKRFKIGKNVDGAASGKVEHRQVEVPFGKFESFNDLAKADAEEKDVNKKFLITIKGKQYLDLSKLDFGSIVSIKGHVYFIVQTYADGSVVICHCSGLPCTGVPFSKQLERRLACKNCSELKECPSCAQKRINPETRQKDDWIIPSGGGGVNFSILCLPEKNPEESMAYNSLKPIVKKYYSEFYSLHGVPVKDYITYADIGGPGESSNCGVFSINDELFCDKKSFNELSLEEKFDAVGMPLEKPKELSK